MKMKYEFTIVASGFDPLTDAKFDDRFYEAGCDDATLSFQKGVIVLEFDRKALSFTDAITSAVENVKGAGAKVERIEPDHLVSLSDIARRAGISRAAVSLYVKGERGEEFPAPVARVTTESPLWNWVDIATWLYKYRDGDKEVAVRAHVVWQINLVFAAWAAGVEPKGLTHTRASLRKYLNTKAKLFESEHLHVN